MKIASDCCQKKAQVKSSALLVLRSALRHYLDRFDGVCNCGLSATDCGCVFVPNLDVVGLKPGLRRSVDLFERLVVAIHRPTATPSVLKPNFSYLHVYMCV